MIKNYLIGGLSLVLIFMLMLNINSCNGLKSSESKVNELRDSVVQVTTFLNQSGQKVEQLEAQVTNNQASIRQLTEDKFNLTRKHEKEIKQIHAYYKGQTSVDIDTQYVPYVDTTGRKKWQDSVMANCKDVIDYYEDSTVLVGTQFKSDSSYYSIEGTVEKNGLKINHISIKDTQYIRFVTLKGGFFKKVDNKTKFYAKRRVVVQVKHTNPYFNTTSGQGILYQPPKNNNFSKGAAFGSIITLGTLIALGIL